MHALVTGATGLFGRHLVDVLVEAGVTVRALVRAGSDTGHLRGRGAALVQGQAGDEASLRRAVEGMDIVFHLAGYLTAGSPFGAGDKADPSEWARYQAINVQFTEAMLAASRGAGVRRFLFVSSSSVYSLAAPVPTPEDAPLAPFSTYGRSKLLAEEKVRAYQEQGLETTIIRPPIAYGPGDRYFTPMALRLAQLPVLPLINGGRNALDLVYAADAAELMWRAASSAKGAGRVYNAGPGRPTSIFDLVQSYRRLQGRGPIILAVSAETSRRTAWLSRRLVKPFIAEAEAALTPEGLALMARDHRLDMSRAAAELDYYPRFSLDEGLAHTLAEMVH
ncbi:MAG: NAD-dependent epimerase/dehydratase family protein [Anaerolineae bacterium]